MTVTVTVAAAVDESISEKTLLVNFIIDVFRNEVFNSMVWYFLLEIKHTV